MADLEPPSVIRGTGIGFRSRHWRQLMATEPDLPWLELLADNFLGAGGMPAYQIDTLAERYPLSLHCVGMSLGGSEPQDFNYLQQVKALCQRARAAWVSDHLCFTHSNGYYAHDLLPLPYTEECLRHISRRINRVQDFLGQTLVLENPSNYCDYAANEFSEAAFLDAIVAETGCKLLLDLNNVYVNQYNRDGCCRDYLRDLPMDAVAEVHLAGFGVEEGYLIDTHGTRVADPVWTLFEGVMTEFFHTDPELPVLVEWDRDVPPLEVLLAERDKAEIIRRNAVRGSRIQLNQQDMATCPL